MSLREQIAKSAELLDKLPVELVAQMCHRTAIKR